MSNDVPDAALPNDEALTHADLNLVGREFGHYRVISELGRGGMATVYKADEQSLNRVVALKVMSRALSQDATMVKRFQREAQAAAQLSHPNIVQIYAIGAEQGINFFTMEYVKGRTLGQLMRERGKLTAAELLPIMIQTAEALGEAHKHNLVHRDIKPSNIMLDPAGRVKVTDFGIARVTTAHTQLTVDGSFLGTPQYMSPEQCDGPSIDGRSDIYSLGVTFYELISGKIPFAGDSPASVLVKIVQGQVIPIQQAAPDLPPSLRAVIEKMMQREPARRYQNADELIAALRQLEPALTGSTGRLAVAASPTSTQSRGRSLAPLAAAAGVAILIGVYLWWPTLLRLLQGGQVAQANAASVEPEPAVRPTPAGMSTREPAAETPTKSPTEVSVGVHPTVPPPSQPIVAPAVTPPVSVTANAMPADPPVELASAPAQTDTAKMAAAMPPATPPATTLASTTLAAATPPAAVPTVAVPTVAVPTVAVPAAAVPPAAVPAAAVPSATTPLVETPPAALVATPAGGNVALAALSASTPPPPPVRAAPPENSMLITATGDSSMALLLGSYAQKFLKDTAYKTKQGTAPGVAPAAVAEFELLVDLADTGTTRLNYLGHTSPLQHSVITLKLIRTASGELVAGPLMQPVEYTGLTATAKLEGAMKKLISELKEALTK